MIRTEPDYCHAVPHRSPAGTKEFNHQNLVLILITGELQTVLCCLDSRTLTDWSWSVSDKCQVKLQHLSSEILSEKTLFGNEQRTVKNFSPASGLVWSFSKLCLKVHMGTPDSEVPIV